MVSGNPTSPRWPGPGSLAKPVMPDPVLNHSSLNHGKIVKGVIYVSAMSSPIKSLPYLIGLN